MGNLCIHVQSHLIQMQQNNTWHWTTHGFNLNGLFFWTGSEFSAPVFEDLWVKSSKNEALILCKSTDFKWFVFQIFVDYKIFLFQVMVKTKP